jgi:hypothetical protein
MRSIRNTLEKRNPAVTGTAPKGIPMISSRRFPERGPVEKRNWDSKAVNRAYARRAQAKIQSLQEYEERTAVQIHT